MSEDVKAVIIFVIAVMAGCRLYSDFVIWRYKKEKKKRAEDMIGEEDKESYGNKRKINGNRFEKNG